MLDNPMRQICEVEFLGKGFDIANPVLDIHSRILNNLITASNEQNLRKIVNSEKSLI